MTERRFCVVMCVVGVVMSIASAVFYPNSFAFIAGLILGGSLVALDSRKRTEPQREQA